ncbi:MAG TPA: glycosyl hydrolase family 32 [Prolixibacteraceae bacterium]|nr:glycosyl hydrolase family 32 [Prolixibacteraceae bacterium]
MKTKLVIILLMSLIVFGCSKNESDETDERQVMKHHELRPFYHFTPPKNWMNDPNGMVYYDGTYHLFYQYYPNGVNWGPMHWAHATSTDLFHWKDKGTKLYPDELGYIFSGSAVVDKNNTAGFKSNADAPLVAIFTHHQNFGGLQQQSLAFSTDKGTTWVKYSGNPVLKNPGITDFRDPKVIWYEPMNKWIMVLAAGNKIKIYSSQNLKDWNFESDFGENLGYHGGVWECPDLFELTDSKGVRKWALLVSIGGGESSEPNGGSSTQYFIGSFNGKTFTEENQEVLWADYGVDNYAGVSWSDIPEKDGRRIFMGWMSNWVYAGSTPSIGWRGAMTVAREVKLAETNGKYTLHFPLLNEINALKDAQQTSTGSTPMNGLDLNNNEIVGTGSYLVEMEIDATLTDDFEISMGNELEKMIISYSKVNAEFVVDRSNSGVTDFSPMFKRPIKCKFIPQSSKIFLQLLVDKSSLEIFINKGEKVMTTLFFPKYEYRFLEVNSKSGKDFLRTYTISALNKSIIRQ